MKHRNFYVNDKLQFSFFLTNEDKETVLKNFFEGHDWKFQAWYCGWIVKETKCNKDLTEIHITVTLGQEKK